MKKINLFYILGIVFFSCASNAEDVGVTNSNGVKFLNFYGEINNKNVETAIKILNNAPDIKNINIKSNNNNYEGSLELALFIGHGKYNIRVIDYCIGSCAQVILPAAENVEIEKGSIIVLGSDLLVADFWLEKNGYKVSDSFKQYIKYLAKYYNAANVDTNMLYCAWQFSKPKLNEKLKTNIFESGADAAFSFKYNGWILSKEELISYGIRNLRYVDADFGSKNIKLKKIKQFAPVNLSLCKKNYNQAFISYYKDIVSK